MHCHDTSSFNARRASGNFQEATARLPLNEGGARLNCYLRKAEVLIDGDDFHREEKISWDAEYHKRGTMMYADCGVCR